MLIWYIYKVTNNYKSILFIFDFLNTKAKHFTFASNKCLTSKSHIKKIQEQKKIWCINSEEKKRLIWLFSFVLCLVWTSSHRRPWSGTRGCAPACKWRTVGCWSSSGGCAGSTGAGCRTPQASSVLRTASMWCHKIHRPYEGTFWICRKYVKYVDIVNMSRCV